MKDFLVGIAWLSSGKAVTGVFVDYEEADKYYACNINKIVRWVLIDYKFGKATLIHDCSGDGVYKTDYLPIQNSQKRLDDIRFEISRADFNDIHQIKESFFMLLSFARGLLVELEKFQQGGGEIQ